MLKRFQLTNGKTLYINTDAVTLIADHLTYMNRVTITLACGTTIDVLGDQDKWAERLTPTEKS